MGQTDPLNSDLFSDGWIGDPHNCPYVISIFNGWLDTAKNYPSFFKNKMPLLLSVWIYRNSIGNLSSTRALFMIGEGKIYSCLYDSGKGSWSDWVG